MVAVCPKRLYMAKIVVATPIPGQPVRPRRRELALLLAPVVVYMAAMGIGVALAPVLLEQYPVLLFLLAPLGRHLLLISPALDSITFVAVGILGYFLVDPFMYILGRRYGDASLVWLEQRSGMMGRGARWLERLFRRAALPVLFVWPGPLVNLLAGAGRMRLPLWVLVNLLGTLASVSITRVFGEVLAVPINVAREFVERHVGVLTLLSVLVVVTSFVLRRRRMRQLVNTTLTSLPAADSAQSSRESDAS
jgi:membrane protein DedA with SNARE-associated domain